ncbi:FAD-dependent oxidoreductase [Donghicola mangrovi]|uniref:FAD-dependent oxidoreductase n=1 Tax=Donghicola mangrovi TaxID=2729614 RepID=A0A850QF70_9RHOB|nr:FAD-dependent oxidoreductase [Donghicola mangrovi]NVO24769.1 FAD-dependent oxidoreductase [Donghicola mangrovi]
MPRPPLTALGHTHYDVVVVGAGAVGCATARELAGRGYKTLLVDRGDIGAGTSSRSSRMLYSGLGYLAVRYPLWHMMLHPIDMLQRLLYTRDVMLCRAELVRDMPQHLTRHRFVYPFRKGDQYPPWLVDIGFRLVEALGAWKVPLAYRRVSPADAARQVPMAGGLGDAPLSIGTFDEYMYAWPERICVDTALDAEARGATLRTYTRVTGIRQQNGHWVTDLEDADDGETVQVISDMVINAAGPWVDRLTGAQGPQPRIVGIKGVNVMVQLPPEWRGQGLEAFSSKGEPYYVFPWRDHHFIGPTETHVTENPDEIRVTDAEIDYILSEANLLFPDLHLTRDHVLHAWCGVRPVTSTDGKSPRNLVRAHQSQDAPGLVTMTGSTIMLHRHAGRLAAKTVEQRLGRRGPAPTGMIEPPTYDGIGQRITPEHVVHLSDLIRRRLPDGLNPDLGLARAEELSRITAAALNWTEEKRLDELRRFEEDSARVYQSVN